MASICMSQNNYQQHHFQMMNNNMLLLQQQQQQQQQHIQQQQQFSNSNNSQKVATTKVLGTSNLQNIQPNAELGPMIAKKKYTYVNMPYGEQMPSVARRNARERNRVKQVNNGFSNLRQHLPQSVVNTLSNGGRGASKKISKVDTLRIAVEYIRGLQDLLDDSASSSGGAAHLDESSNDGSNYGYSSVGSPVDSQYQLAHSYNSEASASPTPSYSDSDISIGGANYLQPSPQEMQFKFEPFDSYNQLANDDEQPDDEELLDYISSWQEQ